MDIERLRALEKKWRGELLPYVDNMREHGKQHNAHAKSYNAGLAGAAEDLRTLIAELGQEVGAVAEMPSLRCRSDACANKGQVHNHCTPRAEATPVGCIHPDTLAMFATDHKAKRVSIERWGQLRELEGYLPLYTSPAHTSEARDAARLDWLGHNWGGQRNDFAMHVLRVGGMGDADDVRVFVDAAMRQEGGNG